MESLSSKIKKKADVAIIGAGPAGLAAAIWCDDLGLSSILFEAEPSPGGQLLRIFDPITNYPGFSSISGGELCKRFAEQAHRPSIRMLAGDPVIGVDTRAKTVVTAAGASVAAGAIIIATGVRRRTLGIPGEAEFFGKGVLASGAAERESVRGKRVIIVGGGDAAVENASMLAPTAREVRVIHRRDRFSARRDLLEAARALENIRIKTNCTLERINGPGRVRSVDVKDLTDGKIARFEADAVLIRIGVQPNTGLFATQLELDTEGRIIVDGRWAASAEGVYCIGDAAATAAPTIAGAVGSAAIAVRSIAGYI